jgi:transposase
LKEYLSRDHLATIAGITPQGKLFLNTYEHAISSIEVVEFLDCLQRQIPGPLLVIWDGSPTHRSKRIKEYLSNGAAKRLHIERFPGYAPELNPTEWVWSYMKVVDLANIACDTLSELAEYLHQSKRRLQRRHNLIQSFIQIVGYQV